MAGDFISNFAREFLFPPIRNQPCNACGWTVLATNLPGTGGVLSVTDTNLAPARFYRLGQSQ